MGAPLQRLQMIKGWLKRVNPENKCLILPAQMANR